MSQLDILEMEVKCGLHKTERQRATSMMLEHAKSLLNTLSLHADKGTLIDWGDADQKTLEWLINEAELRYLDRCLSEGTT